MENKKFLLFNHCLLDGLKVAVERNKDASITIKIGYHLDMQSWTHARYLEF
jgi:hypothetical protein